MTGPATYIPSFDSFNVASSFDFNTFFQIQNSPLVYDGNGFLGIKEIMDRADENKKDEIIKEMERRHKEKMDQV